MRLCYEFFRVFKPWEEDGSIGTPVLVSPVASHLGGCACLQAHSVHVTQQAVISAACSENGVATLCTVLEGLHLLRFVAPGEYRWLGASKLAATIVNLVLNRACAQAAPLWLHSPATRAQFKRGARTPVATARRRGDSTRLLVGGVRRFVRSLLLGVRGSTLACMSMRVRCGCIGAQASRGGGRS